jgi:tryptophan-rich sensory protein
MSYKVEPTYPPTNLNLSFFLSLLFFLGEISRWVHKPNSLKELFMNQLLAKHSFQTTFNFCQLKCHFLLVVVFLSPPTCASNTVVFFYSKTEQKGKLLLLPRLLSFFFSTFLVSAYQGILARVSEETHLQTKLSSNPIF